MIFELLTLAASWGAPAPRPRCGIETRVFCIRHGNTVTLSDQGDFRVWTVQNLGQEIDAVATIQESKNCDSVPSDSSIETQLDEIKDILGRRANKILYSIPHYACMVQVTWSSPPEHTEWARRSALSAIWIGVSSKDDLGNLLGAW